MHDPLPPRPQSWEGGKPWQQEGLLLLVGRIGRERRDPASAAQMLELLWRLAHAPALGSRLVSMAMELHTEVLAEGSGDEQVRREGRVEQGGGRRVSVFAGLGLGGWFVRDV